MPHCLFTVSYTHLQESREETYPRYLAGSEKNADFEDDGVRKSKEKPKENFVREKQKQKASKDPKFHLDNVSGPDIKRKMCIRDRFMESVILEKS